MGEQPIFSSKAHVFHIDPQTKRSWIPASAQAVNVSFFYDSARNLYRIISVEGTKAVINSTITPNMTFTKTSQKFGQWSDIRANTVYGLGFGTELDLNKFIEKFQEVKEATRSAAHQKAQHNGGANIISGTATCPGRASRRGDGHSQGDVVNSDAHQYIDQMGLIPLPHQTDLNLHKSSLHQRSQSLSGLQVNKALTDSPKHLHKDKLGSSVIFPQSSAEAQLRYENDRLKLALAQSSANAKKWEIELLTLKNNNSRLTSALQESTANVEEWKRQLQILKDENNKMRMKVLELEASNGNHEAIGEIRKEINHLRNRSDSLEVEVRQKDKELEHYKQRLDNNDHIYNSGQPVEEKLKTLLNENESLRAQLGRLTDGADGSAGGGHDKLSKSQVEQLNGRLARNIAELRSIQNELTSLLNNS